VGGKEIFASTDLVQNLRRCGNGEFGVPKPRTRKSKLAKPRDINARKIEHRGEETKPKTKHYLRRAKRTMTIATTGGKRRYSQCARAM